MRWIGQSCIGWPICFGTTPHPAELVWSTRSVRELAQSDGRADVLHVMPGEQGYLDWKLTLNGKPIPYGLFLGEVVNFVIVALALFLFIVKFLGWLMRTRKEEVAAAPPMTKDQELLVEIRDLLKHRESVA